MTDQITGLWIAMATPLDGDGNVDHASLVRHGLWAMQHGCDGLVPFGTTGEGPSFSIAERVKATEALLNAGVPAEKIAVGTGCTAIPDTVALTRQLMALGLTHTLILPPFFFRGAPPEGIEDAFAAIIDGVGSDRLRACLYHIPQIAGIGVPAAVLGRLRARYGVMVAGVKDSTGDFSQFQAFRAAAPDCGILVGAEIHINRALAEGGTGTICGMANVVPDMVRAMFTNAAAEPAMQAACDEFADSAFLPLMKAALSAITGDAAWRRVRAPLRAADPARGARIASALAALQARRAA